MTTLRDIGNGKFMKPLVVAEAKAGKTCFLIASCLGALPHQTKGLVTSPQHLHVLSVDTAAVDGVGQFLTGEKTCGKPDSYLDVDILDLSAEVAAVMGGKADWDYSLFSAVVRKVDDLKQRMAKMPGVHAVVVSSLTGLTEAIQRGLAGPPSEGKKGGGMDQSKWQDERRQLVELRTKLQGGPNHCFWEGHIATVGQAGGTTETIGIPGQTGKAWGVNVTHTWRLRRELNVKHGTTLVEKQYVETAPRLEFTSGGRASTLLDAKEYDLVAVAEKLGLAVGGYKP